MVDCVRLTLDTVKSLCFPLLSPFLLLLSLVPVASVNCQHPVCSEKLYGGASDTGMEHMAQGEGRGTDCIVVLNVLITMTSFSFLFFCV